ncbi:hypothetical protein GCM10017673_13470 [Streptosporangium violaceochromogenes]|nr:hypothetical protein GCM10017673_13470 [Streptosporangium violaceochromogenes]
MIWVTAVRGGEDGRGGALLARRRGGPGPRSRGKALHHGASLTPGGPPAPPLPGTGRQARPGWEPGRRLDPGVDRFTTSLCDPVNHGLMPNVAIDVHVK